MAVMHRIPGTARLAVSIHVGRAGMRKGGPAKWVQADRHGRILFSGMWYGAGPREGRAHRSYGKIEGMRDRTMAFPVGRLPRTITAYIRRRLI